MTITDAVRELSMDKGDIHCTADLPAGAKSAVVEDEHGATIVVCPELNAADRIVYGTAERMALIQRRSGKPSRVRIVRAGFYGAWYGWLVAVEVTWRLAGVTWRAMKASK